MHAFILSKFMASTNLIEIQNEKKSICVCMCALLNG